jgi:hypothetical protein
MTITTVCISTFHHKPEAPGFGCTVGLAGFPELRGCYTIRPGIVTPDTALSLCLSMISAQTLCVCREGKPVPTFPDHAGSCCS